MASENETGFAASHEFQCTGYKDLETGQPCNQRFKTAKELRRHKKYRDDHDYCYKCDKDFPDWAAYVKHKSEEPLQHPAACRVCGEEFGSISGMKRHLEASHPVDQNVPCIGCGETFPRASRMIDHLEKGQCPKISAAQFSGHLAHKTIVSKLLKSPEQLAKINALAGYEEAAQDDDEGGGVALLDDSQGPRLEYEALEPEKTLGSVNAPRLGESFPALPSSKPEGQRAMDSLTTSAANMRLSEAAQPGVVSKVAGPDAIAPQNPWSGPGVTKALFPKAKETPPTDAWKYKLRARDLVDENNEINLFKDRFWDPTCKDFDPKRFYHPILMTYQCPFPHCEEKFANDFDLENHILSIHRMRDQRCPSCCKIFKSSAALIAHAEAPNSRCHLSKSDKFTQALDELSGGFLGATYTIRPDHVPHENPEIEEFEHPITKEKFQVEKQPIPVGYNQYESTKPPDWVEPGSELDYLKWTI
ncbi:uncharacterized protein BDZ99DRAFT_431877 [Mytilinidion resinicola]|uniref:C2H2-type domain-containing protein n=1 Tax=Mytilinidion resinicola TaxID=574789 RepID=A0A6A6ZBN8_9PEZI|nr:uncharacterized protein BDZ99DRAFT_431877 [Mytilinidion resinicola]KAF2817637.1 hypothetical protein BDZ99DRAFT_431877 [Mytilinidion resinicola]